MFLWNHLAFSMIQWMLAIWSLVPLPFLILACTSGSSRFMYCWSLIWRIVSITLLACEMSPNVLSLSFEHSLVFSFFRTAMKTSIFQSCDRCWVSQICWLIECSTFTGLSFRVWNSSTGIPSPPLALFVVMLPGEGNGNPLQYSCLENPSYSPWVTKSWTWLSDFTFTFNAS